jgi:biopolymer transport protein TolR
LPNQTRRSLLTRRPSSAWVERRRAAFFCRINAAPFAGIFVALWLIFVANLPGSDLPVWNSVELAGAKHSVPIQGALRDDAIIVSLSASGNIYYGSTHTMPSELVGKIREDLKRGAEKRIYLKVDGRARYGDLKFVFPQITAAGVENITFITR